ncbi:hypothetical protein MMC09_002530 [Bachmanniomyces sp. S44760]|nr:hypothetical protein [Bachmanniomyces sp. S44760]
MLRANLYFHLLVSLCVTCVSAQTNYSSVADAFWQLQNLSPHPPSKVSPRRGGANGTHCCLLAVNRSLEIIDGDLVKSDVSYIDPNVDINAFITANNSGQFPCGAVYNGDEAGAPSVAVPYSYCSTQCGGWEASQSSKLNQWVGPLVGFLIPAVVFCLAIPRRRKLRVSEILFQDEMDNIWSLVASPLRAVAASILVSIDTLIWLGLCFAFAGPMLLSGLYEAFLDNRVLSYLKYMYSNKPGLLTVDMRARIMFVVLTGNLDLTSENPNQPATGWPHVQELVHDLRKYEGGPNPRQYPLAHELPRETNVQDIKRTQTRLRAMLACQYSFGTTVGAPVVFFAGAFVYAMIDTLSHLGDNDTSHALAFGMWWIIIPHISIVSGLLLAGNNPNTLEGVVSCEAMDDEWPAFLGLFELVYPSRYKPAWMWFRGRCKRDWVKRLVDTYKYTNGSIPGVIPFDTPPHGAVSIDPDMEELEKITHMRIRDWCKVFGLAFALVVIPSGLAFLVAYYTPRVGISCRSLTFLIYTIAQFLLMLLWVWLYETSSTDINDNAHSPLHSRWGFIWYGIAALAGGGAIFTAIGGTMMQIMGVYRNCYCEVSIQYWRRLDDPQAFVILGTNTAADIAEAKTWWKGTGLFAIGFLAIMCYGGWWYQRRLRGIFRVLVMELADTARTR